MRKFLCKLGFHGKYLRKSFKSILPDQFGFPSWIYKCKKCDKLVRR